MDSQTAQTSPLGLDRSNRHHVNAVSSTWRHSTVEQVSLISSKSITWFIFVFLWSRGESEHPACEDPEPNTPMFPQHHIRQRCPKWASYFLRFEYSPRPPAVVGRMRPRRLPGPAWTAAVLGLLVLEALCILLSAAGCAVAGRLVNFLSATAGITSSRLSSGSGSSCGAISKSRVGTSS